MTKFDTIILVLLFSVLLVHPFSPVFMGFNVLPAFLACAGLLAGLRRTNGARLSSRFLLWFSLLAGGALYVLSVYWEFFSRHAAVAAAQSLLHIAALLSLIGVLYAVNASFAPLWGRECLHILRYGTWPYAGLLLLQAIALSIRFFMAPDITGPLRGSPDLFSILGETALWLNSFRILLGLLLTSLLLRHCWEHSR